MVKQLDVRLAIIRLLLSSGEDLAVHDMARKLKKPPSQVFYHLGKLVEWGVLIREETEDRVYYGLQPIFTEHTEETKQTLAHFAEHVKDPDDWVIAQCLFHFLQVYEVVGHSKVA